MNTAAVMAEIDHLVVVADTLEQGAAWCEAVFGLVPGPGGRHGFMGTHNRLLKVGSVAFPRAYLEIIAIDPQAPPPGRPRWFGMDEPALRDAVRREPRLVQAVARCADLKAALARLQAAAIDAGQATAASRETPHGTLSWQIAVRADGRLACAGACPTLIQWGAVHPTAAMPASSLSLTQCALGGLPEGLLAVAGVRSRAAPGWQATLAGPLGEVTLSSFTAWHATDTA